MPSHQFAAKNVTFTAGVLLHMPSLLSTLGSVCTERMDVAVFVQVCAVSRKI